MTCSPLQAKIPQPATEYLDHEYPLVTMKPYQNAYKEDPK